MARFCDNCGSMLLPGKGCPRCRSNESVEQNDQSSLFDVFNSKTPKTVEIENKEAPYLPYKPREFQLDIIATIRNAFDAGKHIVVESGTGTGKTIVSLAAALEHAKPKGKKIIYLTRTISQSDQVMRELKAISSLKSVKGIAITGRAKSCPMYREKEVGENASVILRDLCEKAKEKGKCRYFRNLDSSMESALSYCVKEFPNSNKLDAFCEKIDVCPYEMKKALMKEMDVVAAPYIHILSDDIRDSLLKNLGIEEEKDYIVIIDEAHNLVDAARSQESFSIHMRNISSALDECTTFRDGDFIIYNEITMKTFCNILKNVIKSISTSKIPFGKKEAVLNPIELEEMLIDKLKIDINGLSKCVENICLAGEERNLRLIENGETKRSDISILGESLSSWVSSPIDKFVKSVKINDDGEVLHGSCISPTEVVSFLNKSKGVLHMSGTLKPLDQYIVSMNLPSNTLKAEFPSPFPKENKKVIYMDNVTTRMQDMKEDPAMQNKITRSVAKMCNAVHKNTLVFFPSYDMMRKMRDFLERDIKKPVYWEERGRTKRTMESLDIFRKGRDGVFCCVMGGTISEGLDFPGDELCFAIIVGIPYPPPSIEGDAMTAMFEKKYGRNKGWEYVNAAPALRKMNQAIGRLIRTETDRGMAVIMDKRASRYLKELSAELSTNPLDDVISFFDEQKN